jgi:short-subunit dehydrogenase
MARLSLQNRWVLVTGASSGLGHEMACQLAADHRANLILVARRADKLEALRDALVSKGVSVRIIAADVSREEDADRVFHESIAAGDLAAVILNAGVTYFGAQKDMAWDSFKALLATNVTAVVQLMHLFVPWFAARPQGGAVMITSSMAGLLPVPYQSAYAGSKAFVTQFAQSVYQEIRDTDVSITVFCPGGIDTDMTTSSGLAAQFANTPFLQDVNSCAREALDAMVARKHLYVAGKLNRLQLFMTRAVPRRLVTAIAGTAYRQALDKRDGTR